MEPVIPTHHTVSLWQENAFTCAVCVRDGYALVASSHHAYGPDGIGFEASFTAEGPFQPTRM